MHIHIPEGARYIIDHLKTAGFDAYAVGGCVRDSILGKAPKDWDICTSAIPRRVMECFKEHHVIETGLKHGTITIMLGNVPFEVTTYRIDGNYSDNRHPDSVAFTNTLKEDLSRRDFTINAMAYNPAAGVVDFFGGISDLRAGIIKCVGDPDKRFQEDALRIMRALRFASELGFSIDGDTSAAMRKNRKLLNNISAERIAGEIRKLIIGNNAGSLLLKHLSVLTEIIPEMTPAIGFEQNNPNHCYDVLRHILLSVDNAPENIHIRLAMLFHDIAKPACYTETDGIGHFYVHPQVSSDMAKKILLRLKYDNDTIETVTQLILYHDADIQPRRKHIKRWLNKIGEKRFRQLLEVKRADALAQAPHCRNNKIAGLNEIIIITDDIIKQRQCFSLKDLAVNGRDLISIGVPQGVKIGVILNQLIDKVIDEQVQNDKSTLLEMAGQLAKQL